MPLSEFLEGMRVFQSVYQAFNADRVRDRGKVTRFCLWQERVFFLKRIWGLIKKGDFSKGRETAYIYMRSRGPINIFFVIWCSTFLGAGMNFVMELYARLTASMANGKVGLHGTS